MKSFSRAGEAIHLSQPTVSSHIKDLEEHFGLQLVDRLVRRVEPTKAGLLLYKYAKRLLCLRDEAETAMAAFQGRTKGELVIGGSTIPAGYILPPIIGSFSTAFPDVSITLIVGDTSEIIRKTLALEVELAVVGALADNKGLEQTPLVRDEMRLVVPSDHKWAKRRSVGIHALMNEPLIIREHGSGTLRSFEQSLKQAGVGLENFNIVARMGSTQAICQGIKSKVGISVLSSLAVRDDAAAGRLCLLNIDRLKLVRDFYLTTARNRTPSPLSRRFIDFITKRLAKQKVNRK